MPKTVKPTVLLGLGKYGAEIAQEIYNSISEKQEALSQVTSGLILKEDGDCWDIQLNKSVLKCKALKPDLSSGSFSSNFAAIKKQEEEFKNILEDKIKTVRSIETLLKLQDREHQIEEDENVFLITTLFDPIGSAAVIPFLGFIQSLAAGKLRGTTIDVDLLLFFPDLFGEYKANDLAYTRSYCCLQELDFLAEHPDRITTEEHVLFRFAWLFSGKNEKNVNIGSYKNLIPMISDILVSLLTGKVASDESFSTMLINKVAGKTTRYCSFGFAKLVFPVESLIRGLSDYLGFNILESRNVSTHTQFDKERISADVKEFLLENRFDRLPEEMELDDDGKRIWSNFSYKASIHEGIIVENFLRDIKEDEQAFADSSFTDMRRNLSIRKESLLLIKKKNLLNVLIAAIDSNEKGVYYSQALLDMLQNRESSYVKKGVTVERPHTMDDVEQGIKSFFDPTYGTKRSKLAELKQEIDDKSTLLRKLKSQLKKLKDEEKEDTGKGKIGSNESEIPEGSEKALKKEQGENAGLKSNGKKKKLESTAIESLRKQMKLLKAKIGPLREKRSKLSQEIDNLDLQIADPSERRKLLDRFVKEIRDEIDAVNKELFDTDNRYRHEKHRLNQLYDERSKIIRRLFIFFPGVGTAGCLAILFLISLVSDVSLSSIFKVGLKIYPFALIGYGILGFLSYWYGVRKSIKEAVKSVDSLKNEKLDAFVRYQKLCNRIFRKRFEYSLYGNLLEWLEDYKGFAAKTTGELESFTKKVIGCTKDKEAAWENLVFPNDLFVRSVVTKEDLNEVIKKTARLPIETERFFKKKPLSAYFMKFREFNEITTLTSELDSFSEEVFYSVRERSVEKFLKEKEREGRINVTEKLSNFFASAKAFIFLDVESGMDSSQPMVYLGVENPETSYVKEKLKEQGHTEVQTYGVRNKSEIVLTKLKIGYPAFHIALIRYGYNLLSRNKDKKGFYVNPKWRLDDLFPSTYTLGDEQDLARRTACLGKVFGLIVEREGAFCYENEELGQSYQDMVCFLRTSKGSSVKRRLSKQIEREKQEEAALELLIEHREKESGNLDEVDREIINQIIRELSPLA